MGVSHAPFTHTLRASQDGWWIWRQLEEAGEQDVRIQLPGWGELLPSHDQLLSPRQRRRTAACPAHSVSLRGLLPIPSLDSRKAAAQPTLRSPPPLPACELEPPLSTTNFKFAGGQTKNDVCPSVINFRSTPVCCNIDISCE